MSDTITVADIRKAIEAIKSQKPRDICPPHIVHPPPPGSVWAYAEPEDSYFLDDKITIVRCANLCGFAMYVRAIPE